MYRSAFPNLRMDAEDVLPSGEQSRRARGGDTLTITKGPGADPSIPRPIGRDMLSHARRRRYNAPITNQPVAQRALITPHAVTRITA